MRRAYQAILRGDRVEWLADAPETDGPVRIYITISYPPDPGDPPAGGPTVFESLQALADMGAFDDIDDPVAWQRQQRQDRPLPFRDYNVGDGNVA